MQTGVSEERKQKKQNNNTCHIHTHCTLGLFPHGTEIVRCYTLDYANTIMNINIYIERLKKKNTNQPRIEQ